ncbi:MAG TPA: hypothetical protein VK730_00525 [Solirubrobacteraceae bacterium]|nr:hypothetical protein [Solirubrobacteraceae bacterium]
MAGADEAEQTPQAAARTPQTAAQTAQPPEQAPGAAQSAALTAEQASAAANHAAQSSGQQTSEAEPPVEQAPPAPGFGERGRMRRRARFLRKARELAYRDLGGLVFDLHRFGQRNDPLVLAKLATLREIDTELRGLEDGLHDHRPVTVLREVGIAACPRCAAIHGSDDRFCPGCGLAFDANADRPISTAPVAPQIQAAPAPAQAPLATPPATTIPASAAASAPAPVTAPAPTPTPAMPSTPPLKPTAPPVAARPTGNPPATVVKTSSPPAETKPASPPASEPKAPEQAQEDEPTQILRPPAGDASP